MNRLVWIDKGDDIYDARLGNQLYTIQSSLVNGTWNIAMNGRFHKNKKTLEEAKDACERLADELDKKLTPENPK